MVCLMISSFLKDGTKESQDSSVRDCVRNLCTVLQEQIFIGVTVRRMFGSNVNFKMSIFYDLSTIK